MAEEDADCISAEGVRTPLPQKCHGYDTKRSDGDASAQEVGRMWSSS